MARRKVYLFVLAVLLVLLTALLSAAALRIWQEGSARKAENPLEAVYTPEKVKEQMLRISPLLFAVAGMAAVGLLMGIRDEESIRPVSSPETERDRLSARLGAPGEGIRKERKRQRILRWIRWTAFAACMVPVMIYCAEKGHFPEDDLEAMIVALVFHTGPWVAAGLLMLSVGALLEEKSIHREIEAARAQLKGEKSQRKAAAAPEGTAIRGAHFVRAVLLVAAGVFIILGILNGSLNDVLLKAINICTECIGLG